MRIQQGLTSRLSPIDRNNTIVESVGYAAAAIGPHALTTRASYTVPNARSALVVNATMDQVRTTVATTVGRVKIQYGKSTAGARHAVTSFNLAAGTSAHDSRGQNMYFTLNGIVQLDTEDLSIGGAVDYNAQLSIVEFDA